MRKILIIDSDATFASYLARALTGAGYHVSVAGSGREGLAEATQTPPDLVVLTPELSDVNGLNVARRLRVDGRTRGVRVFMVSARTHPHDILNGALAGADAYFSRYPGVEAEIVAKIGAVLAPASETATGMNNGLVALVGAAGGVGVSTLTLNLAHVLGAQMRALAADLSGAIDTLADRVGLEPHATAWPDTLGAARSTVVQSPEWACDILPGVRVPFDARQARPERALDVVRHLQVDYDVVLADAGRGLDGPGAPALIQAAAVVVVLSADTAQVAPARRLLDFWQGQGIGADRLLLVVNHAHGADGLSLPQLERALGLMAWAEVPYGRMLAANRMKQPLERSYPRDPAAAVIRDLAAGLAQHLGVLAGDNKPATPAEGRATAAVERPAADERRRVVDIGRRNRVGLRTPGR